MTDERIKEFAIKAGLPMCQCGCDMPTRQVGTFARLLLEEFESFFTVLPQESAQTEENFVQKSVDEDETMNDMKFTTAGDYMKDVDMIEEPTDEVIVEKAAAERLRKSEAARAKRKEVKEKKELNRGVFDKSKLTYTDGDNT